MKSIDSKALLSQSRSEFLANGWSSITSPSIVRDCGVLVGDIYYLARKLSLLKVDRARDAEIALLVDKFQSSDGEPQDLHRLSRTVGKALFDQALEDRSKVSSIYDLAKHLQSFHALLHNRDLQQQVRNVLSANTVFIHKDSVGVRIDVPGESAQLTDLHQEFHSFPFGVNGLVIWTPLTKTDRIHGTVGFHPRSHQLPPLPFDGDPSEQQRLNDLGRFQEAQKAGGLQVTDAELGTEVHIEAEPGHCYLFSAVLPHVSIPADEASKMARITCQARLFDVDDDFFRWKHEAGRFWDGLKQPNVGWELWSEFTRG